MTTNRWQDDELRSLRAMTREFARREILPHQERWEAEGELPRALHRTAGDAGLLGAAFPAAVGGGGGDLRVMTTVVEALHESGVAGGVQASLFTCGIALPHLVEAGNPEQIDRWVRPTFAGDLIGALAITEPSGGSDVGHLRTTARREGDHYVVNGAKTYITSGCRADFVVAAVRSGGPGARGVSLLVIEKDTPGFEVSRKLDKMGGAPPTPPSCRSPTPGCRRPTSSGPRAWGSPSSGLRSSPRESPSRRRHTRSPSGPWT
jgi:acyl-CoA dehydrogenase